MLDPASALGVAASLIQLLDFTRKLITETHSIYRTGKDGQVKRQELEVISNNLSQLNGNLRSDLLHVQTARVLTFEEEKLVEVCVNVGRVSGELRRAVDNVKVNSQFRAWKCFREALNIIWDEQKINHIAETLHKHREEIGTFILAFLRKRIDEVLDLSQSMKKQLHQISEKHDDLSNTLLGFVDESRAWQAELVNVIHQQNWKAYVDVPLLGVQLPNAPQIESVSGILDKAANQTRDAFLRDRLLGRLQFPSIRDRFDHIPQAEPTTFNWIFDSSKRSSRYLQNFATWLRKGDGIYWITGKPASGKSTLMKFLQQSSQAEAFLEEWAPKRRRGRMGGLVTASYFFWKAGHKMQKTQQGLLQTLLHDLFSQQPHLLPAIFPERWKRCILFGDDPSPWSWQELRNAFLSFISRNSYVFIIIDGLDECEDSYDDLINLLKDAVSSSMRTKICLGSRPEQKFQDAFGRFPSFRMQDLTRPDILSFVHRRLCAHAHFAELLRRERQYATELVVAIARRSSGVFLWVHLVVRSLLDGLGNSDRIQDLSRRLNCIPPELDDLYSSILHSLDTFYLEHASKIFQLVRATPETLTLLDLSFADEEDERSCFNADVQPLPQDEYKQRCNDVLRRLSSRCKGFIEASTSEGIDDAQRTRDFEPLDATTMAGGLDDEFWDDGGDSDDDGQRMTPLSSNTHGRSLAIRSAPNQTVNSHEHATHATPWTQNEQKIGWKFCAACRRLSEYDARELCIGAKLIDSGWNTKTLGYSGKVSAHLYKSLMWSINDRRRLGLPTVDRFTDQGKQDVASMILHLHDLQHALENGSDVPSSVFGYSWDEGEETGNLHTMTEELLTGAFGERVKKNECLRKVVRPQATLYCPKKYYNAGAPPPEPLRDLPNIKLIEGRSPNPLTYMGWYTKLDPSILLVEPEILQSTAEAMYKPDEKAIQLKQLHHSEAYRPIAVPEVDCLHRTAKDFVEKPENWKILLGGTAPIPFYPSVSLLKSSILLLKRLPDQSANLTKFWTSIRWTMALAARMEEGGGTSDVDLIDEIDRTASRVFQLYGKKLLPERGRGLSDSKQADFNWVSTEPGRAEYGGNFVSLAVEYDLIDYVRTKQKEGLDVTHDDRGRPMLDYVFFSANPLKDEHEKTAKRYDPPSVGMVQVLLEAGADPNEWSDKATPWQRALRKLSDFQAMGHMDPKDRSESTQQWYNLFVAFIEAGADPKADYNSPKGSFAREVFEDWDATKAGDLQKLIRKRQNKLPRWGRKMVQRFKAGPKPR